MKPRLWFERVFELGLPSEAFPDIVERLRGTPARLEERIGGIAPSRWTRRLDERWSIQEEVGHLLDLEPLWYGRVEDLESGTGTLRPADLSNTATHEANHNETTMVDLLRAFRTARGTMVAKLDAAAESDLKVSALHPRLLQPMTLVDLVFFVAEHDDHHLARIGGICTKMDLEGI